MDEQEYKGPQCEEDGQGKAVGRSQRFHVMQKNPGHKPEKAWTGENDPFLLRGGFGDVREARQAAGHLARQEQLKPSDVIVLDSKLWIRAT